MYRLKVYRLNELINDTGLLDVVSNEERVCKVNQLADKVKGRSEMANVESAVESFVNYVFAKTSFLLPIPPACEYIWGIREPMINEIILQCVESDEV